MDKQLSMFSDVTPKPEAISNEAAKENKLPLQENIPQDDEYEALDYQLADLMVELNDYIPSDDASKKTLNKILRHCTLEISKRTREGQIAIEIIPEHQALIIQTTVVGEAGEYMPLIIDTEVNGAYLYLNRYWQYQQRLADQINERIANTETLTEVQQKWAQNRLGEYFKIDANSTEINWQRRAAELALQTRFLIVSGGPGTGKTTTITRLLALLVEQYFNNINDENSVLTEVGESPIIREEYSTRPKNLSFNILLAAPTGKAAIRMLDSMREVSLSLQTELGLDEAILSQMPKQANTIHKLLGYKHNSAQFKHNKNKPLKADVVLVDEASMIDIALMSKLVDAVPAHAKLILIGDKDQLSSVETGSVFADMCEGLNDSNYPNTSPKSSLITLRKNWRFSKDSDIGQCAISANQGDSKTLLSVLNDPDRPNAKLISPAKLRDAELIKPWQYYFAVLNDSNSSLTEIFSAFNQYRILNALRRGFNGSEIMNSRIETALEKQGLIKRRRGNVQQSSHWYHGRPIMITQNSYNRGLFNGDTGLTIIRDGEIKVFFPSADDSLPTEAQTDDSQFHSFSPIRLPAHETTWAMTIHKSQGSEFNQVVLILPQEEIPLLTRQLVYTGITRAKETVSIVASEDVLVAGVKSEVIKATRIFGKLKGNN